MLAKKNCECGGCGAPVRSGVNHVRVDKSGVYACEECDPECITEDLVASDAPIKIRVRVGTVRHTSADGKFVKCFAELDGPQEIRKGFEFPPGARKPFVVIGPLGRVTYGDVVILHGTFEVDRSFGFQFKAKSPALLAIAESERALVTWLSRFPQIGDIRARAILKEFGGFKAVLSLLDGPTSYKDLTKIKGITEERAEKIKSEYDRTQGYRDFMLFAAEADLPEYLASQALEKWDLDALPVLRDDPYALMDLDRVGFKRADQVAAKLQIPPDDPRRAIAQMRFLFLRVAMEHTFIDEDEVLSGAAFKTSRDLREIKLSREAMEHAMTVLEQPRKRTRRGGMVEILPPLIVRIEGRVYIKELYDAENNIVRELKRLSDAEARQLPVPVECWKGREPAPEQQDAVELFASNKIIVMTGGPGTGKTFVTNAMIYCAEQAGLNIQLVAPTGKAARRATELTRHNASTIHRLLARNKAGNMDDEGVLPIDVLIIDEASMVDVLLMDACLALLPDSTRVVIVGDIDQLPSIGPGLVLRDIIESEAVPVVRLTRIFRQQSDGLVKRIPDVARDINEGRVPDINVKGTNVVFATCTDPSMVQAEIVRAVTKAIPEKYGFSPEEIQVIAAQKGEQDSDSWLVGVRGLNLALQDALNPKTGAEANLSCGDGYEIRVGDRIVQKMNNYGLELVNGEQGEAYRCSNTPFVPSANVVTSRRTQELVSGKSGKRVRSKDRDTLCEVCGGSGRTYSVSSPTVPCETCKGKGTTVYSLVQEDEEPVITMLGQFADKMVGFERGELSALHLAYAMTAHSSQGSEFKAVVVPILKQHSFMLTRQLLYTIITRAQEYVLLIGDPAVLAKAVRNTRGSIRSTSLRDRLRVSFGLPTLTQVAPIATEELVRAPVILSPEEEDAINQLL